MAKSKSMNNNDWNGSCCGGYCSTCKGVQWFVVGILLIINAYWPFLGWGALVGIIAAVWGIVKMSMRGCGHCK